MRARLLGLVALASIGALACQTPPPRMTVDVNEHVDPATIQKIGFWDDRDGIVAEPGSPRDLTRKAITRELEARNFEVVTPDQADGLVTYFVGLKTKARVHGGSGATMRFDGYVTIILRDPESGSSLWFGVAERTWHEGMDPKATIDEFVAALFEGVRSR